MSSKENLNAGNKRSYGCCQQCGKEYHNRKKPKVCVCGEMLGGTYVEKEAKKERKVLPASVIVYENELGHLKSIKMNNNGDRKFLFQTESDLICYNKNCQNYRSASIASNVSFECKHSKRDSVLPLYSVTQFQVTDITEFTSDTKKQHDMISLQSLLNDTNFQYPVVTKVSSKSYAVKAFTATTAEMNYIHVKIVVNKDTGKCQIRCMANGCRKKKGRTKTVSKCY